MDQTSESPFPPTLLIAAPGPIVVPNHKTPIAEADWAPLLGKVNGEPIFGRPAGTVVFHRIDYIKHHVAVDPQIDPPTGTKWTVKRTAWGMPTYEFLYREQGWAQPGDQPRKSGDFGPLFGGKPPEHFAEIGLVTQPASEDDKPTRNPSTLSNYVAEAKLAGSEARS